MVHFLYTINSNVKKIAKKIVIFLGLLQIISVSMYLLLKTLDKTDVRDKNDLGIYMEQDCYIFGHSRAEVHYNPIILDSKLPLSFFNIGSDSKNAVYQLSLLRILLKTHKPKLIIYEVGDFYEEMNAGSDVFHKHYYYDSVIRKMINKEDRWAKIKFINPLYCYNRDILTIVHSQFVNHSPRYQYKGYVPVDRVMHDNKVAEISTKPEIFSDFGAIDINALEHFVEFINTCKLEEIDLILCFSPVYLPQKPNKFHIIEEIAKTNNIPLLDFYNDKTFNYHSDLFYDNRHLNENGANIYTNLLAEKIIELELFE